MFFVFLSNCDSRVCKVFRCRLCYFDALFGVVLIIGTGYHYIGSHDFGMFRPKSVGILIALFIMRYGDLVTALKTLKFYR